MPNLRRTSLSLTPFTIRKSTRQSDRLQRQLDELRDEKAELDEEIREAQATVAAAASATQAGQFDDLQDEIECAEADIKAAQDAQVELKAQKKAVRKTKGWWFWMGRGVGGGGWTDYDPDDNAHLSLPIDLAPHTRQLEEEELQPLVQKEQNELKRNKELNKVGRCRLFSLTLCAPWLCLLYPCGPTGADHAHT